MFKLSIECTKDIDSINIVFSDGKVAAVTSGDEIDDDQILSAPRSKRSVVPRSVVQKPEVPETDDRKVRVADNLQNLDI